MKPKRGAPKKPAEKSKNSTKQIRLGAAELETFQAAADLAGLSVSSWMRERLRTVAREELKAAGRDVPFLVQ
jgi:hypothetical protein